VTVQVADGQGSTDSQAIAVTVTAGNDNAPVITSGATASVAENTTAVMTVTATDADQPAQTLSYSIIGGADAIKFTINSSTGALSFLAAPDFETPTDAGGDNVYDVTVQVSDGQGSTDSQAIAVTVTAANDNAPVITSGATASVAENTTAVMTVTATDSDQPAQTLSFSIVGGADAAKFAINSSTGALSFLAAPDFEAPTDAGGNNVYNVTVQVVRRPGGYRQSGHRGDGHFRQRQRPGDHQRGNRQRCREHHGRDDSDSDRLGSAGPNPELFDRWAAHRQTPPSSPSTAAPVP
jgi:type III secretion system FlhB-like substrate exporter